LAIEREDWQRPARVTRSADAVFAYLILHRRRAYARDELAGMFWGGVADDRARACLNTVLWRIRKVLESDDASLGQYIDTTASGDIRFGAAGGYWLDVTVFEGTLDALLPVPPEQLGTEELRRLGSVANLYTGDLLSGVFDDSALTERARLRARMVERTGALDGGPPRVLMVAHRACGNLQELRLRARRPRDRPRYASRCTASLWRGIATGRWSPCSITTVRTQ
jgi:DNA-binding SARP family transcriptional activator